MDRTPAVWALSDAPWAGGAERYLQWLLEAAGPGRMGLVVVDRPGLAQWSADLEAAGFTVDRIAPASLPSQWLALYRWAQRRRPKLVHVNLPGPNDGLFAVAPTVLKTARVPRVIVTEHLPSVGCIGKRGLLKRFTIPSIDKAITVCEAHLEVMQREFGYTDRQLVAIPNGIVDPWPSDGPGPQRQALPEELARIAPPGRHRIVQVGSLDPRKGADRLIRAFAQADVEASLWLVGAGEMQPEIESLLVELDLQGRVVLTGQRGDLPRLLAAFDVVALASEREGMPYVLLEAAAMARPVVATAVDGVPEIVESGVNGILVGPGDTIGLARELATMLRMSAEGRARMGAAGRTRFEREFRLERNLAHTWQVYGEVATGWPTSTSS